MSAADAARAKLLMKILSINFQRNRFLPAISSHITRHFDGKCPNFRQLQLNHSTVTYYSEFRVDIMYYGWYY